MRAELRNTLDELETARGQAMREEVRKATGNVQGFARGFNVGEVGEAFIRKKVNTLREIKALYLIEMAKRGIKLETRCPK